MTARWLPGDEPFFREWRARQPGQRRSLERSRLFAAALSLDLASLPPALVVVGSKGKGTAVACASAALASYGLRVGSVTSPPFRTNRERIRIDGRALSPPEYDALAVRVDAAIDDLPPARDGYLAPTGIYTLAGLAFLVDAGVEVLVVEEGLGGRSDEVSLVPPDVVAVTPIFAEHVGVLGSTVAEIAGDLLAVVRPATRAVVSAPQLERVAPLLRGAAGPVLEYVEEYVVAAAAARAGGLGAANAAVGFAAAAALVGKDVREALDAAPAVHLPGRLSVHAPAGGHQGTWLVDGAISPLGVDVAVAEFRRRVGEPGLVLAAFPDVKDAPACYARLAGLPVLPVRAGESYLRYDDDAAPARHVDVAAAMRAADSAGDVLVVGTISLVGEALEHLGVDTDRWW